MARVFLTGSSDGIGLAAARLLADQGHYVMLHARNNERAKQSMAAVPNAAGVLIGDLSSIAAMKRLAEEANDAGPWDAVIHNAGIGPSAVAEKTIDGLHRTFAVNSLAPYVLTALMDKPKRLLYMSSGLHESGDGSLTDIAGKTGRKRDSYSAYSDSKLQNVILANSVARLWSDVQSCSMNPGWVKTKMGGSGAPGSVDKPVKMLASYAVGEHFVGGSSGKYFDVRAVREPHSAAKDIAKQDLYLQTCRKISGVELNP